MHERVTVVKCLRFELYILYDYLFYIAIIAIIIIINSKDYYMKLITQENYNSK